MAKTKIVRNKWQGRYRKTYQDNQSSGQRDRVHDWDRRRQFMQDHKPRRSTDWLAFKG